MATARDEDLPFELYEREDEFGPYLSAQDNVAVTPTLDDFAQYPEAAREEMLAIALKYAPEPAKPEEMTYELAARAQAQYSSADMKLKEAQEARKVAARWVLCQEPSGPVTGEEKTAFKTSDPLLVHAHRTRKMFNGVSMAVLAGWAYDESRNGDVEAIHVNKDIAAAIKAAEDKRKASS